MKGIVFDIKENGVYIMDKNGCFHFVPAYMERCIGDEIEFVLEPENDAFLQKIKYSRVFAMNNITKRYVSVAAAFIFAITGFFIWNHTPHYIYVEINPFLETAFNHFDRQIRISGLNHEGEKLIESAKIKGSYTNMAMLKLELARANGHNLDGVILVTFASNNSSKIEAECVKQSLYFQEYGYYNIIVDSCNLAYRKRALDMGVSPGRLKLAERLRELAPSVTLDDALKMDVTAVLEKIVKLSNIDSDDFSIVDKYKLYVDTNGSG